MSPLSVEQAKDRACKVRLVMIDVHGVLTDEIVFYGEAGEIFRGFHHRDGTACIALQQSGIEVAWVTARSKTAEVRAQAIKLKRMYFEGDKEKKLDELEEELGLTDEEVCFVGDDLVDIPVMKRVGFAVAPADARKEAKAVAHYITETAGGRGVIDEIAEFILETQGKWEAWVDRMLSMYKQLK